MKYDLEQLYYDIASYKGLPFPVGVKNLPGYYVGKWKDRASSLAGALDLPGQFWNGPEIKDVFGRNVIVAVSIDGVVFGSPKENHIHLQPMMVVECSKKIVSTPIPGSNYPGTVKELINIDDYKIKLTGAVVNVNQKEYPWEQVGIIKALWQKNTALSFGCTLTIDLFTEVVIKKLKFEELRKAPGIQMYEMELESDGGIEAEVLKQE